MRMFISSSLVLLLWVPAVTAAPLGSGNGDCAGATVVTSGTYTGLHLSDHWYLEMFTHNIAWYTDYDWYRITVLPGETLTAQVHVTHVVGQYTYVDVTTYESDPVTCTNNLIPGSSGGAYNSTPFPKDYLVLIYAWSALPQGDLDLDYDLVIDSHLAAVHSYCPGLVNSTGSAAVLTAYGSTSLSANNLVFTANQLPPSSPALLFDGTTVAQVPFGDGLRCVGGTQHRLVRQSAVGGVWTSPLDFTTLPPGAAITVGSTRYFQLWYRNVNGPLGSGFNLTNGLQVSFSS